MIYQFPRITQLFKTYNNGEDYISWSVGRNGVEEILDKCLEYPYSKHYEFWIIINGKVSAQIIGGNLEVIRGN